MSVVPRGYGEAGPEAAARAAPAASARRTSAARGAHRVLMVLALVGSLHALFLLGVEGWRFVQEQRAVTRLQNRVSDLQTEAKGLNQVIDHAGDKTYREDLARRQGFMYPNELRAVTQAPPAPPPASAAPTGP